MTCTQASFGVLQPEAQYGQSGQMFSNTMCTGALAFSSSGSSVSCFSRIGFMYTLMYWLTVCHAKSRADEWLGAARGGEHGQLAGIQPHAISHQRLARLHVFTAPADVQSIFASCDSDSIAVSFDIFLHDDPQVFARQRRAGCRTCRRAGRRAGYRAAKIICWEMHKRGRPRAVPFCF